MARYESLQPNAAPAPLLRRWLWRALVFSLILHAGLFVFMQVKRLEKFTLGEGAPPPAPVAFSVQKVTIDPKTLSDPEELKATLQDKPKPPAKIDVPVEKIEPAEVAIKPVVPEIASPLLHDKPKQAPINTDLLAKAEANSAGAMDKEIGSLASSLLKESTPGPRQPVVLTMPNGSKDVGGGTTDRDGIPGLRSLDDALAMTGPLPSGDKLGMPGGALFEYDKADLLQQAIDDLQKLGELIRRNPKATFQIEGHTDSFGNAEYNVALSKRRADAVKDWLVANMGVAPEQVQTFGYGSSRPIAPVTGTVEEQAPNRRVEIVIKTNRGR